MTVVGVRGDVNVVLTVVVVAMLSGRCADCGDDGLG